MANIPSTITYDSLAKSGVIPRGEQSAIARAFDRLRTSGDKAEFHAVEAVKGVRQIGESAVAGALLGAVHAALPHGLDMKPTATSTTTVPLDALAAFAGLVAGTFMASEPHGVGKTLMNGGAAAAAVFSFRQTNDLMTRLKIKASGVTPGGGAALPNANAAAAQPGIISKATFSGDPRHTNAWGSGFARPGLAQMGEDPVVTAARGL